MSYVRLNRMRMPMPENKNAIAKNVVIIVVANVMWGVMEGVTRVVL
jgi:hypothetical protein